MLMIDFIPTALFYCRILIRKQLKFINDQRGYLVCDVTPDAWTTRFRVMDQVSTPGGTIATRASITVPRGQPSLTIA